MFLLSLLLQIALVVVGLLFALLSLLNLIGLYLAWHPKRRYRTWWVVAIGWTGINVHLLGGMWAVFWALCSLTTLSVYDFLAFLSTVNPDLIMGLMVSWITSNLIYTIGAWVAPRDIRSSLQFFEPTRSY